MISGYPFAENESFFTHFVNKMAEHELSDETESKIVSLHGFPVTRAVKHLEKRVLKNLPSVVIVQFGSTDVATVTLRDKFRIRKKKPSNTAMHIAHLQQSIKWDLRSITIVTIRKLLSKLLKFPPKTNLEDYITNMQYIIQTLISRGISPIILSPFYSADPLQVKNARVYSKALEEICKQQGTLFIDCFHFLKKQNQNDILLIDRFHLSKKGHELLGNYIFKEYIHYQNQVYTN